MKRDRVADIARAITRIETIAAEGRSAFEASEVLQAAALHNLQILGEAAARMEPEERERFSSVSWSEIVAMRNVIVHQYFDIDLALVWRMMTVDIAELRTSLETGR